MPDPTPDARPGSAPSDAEVEAALGELCGLNEGDSAHADLIRARIAALRSENAALAAERDEAKKQAQIAVNSQRTICRAAERLTAERDALRGEVRELVASASPMNVMPSGRVVDYALTVSAATLARLQSESARGGEGAE